MILFIHRLILESQIYLNLEGRSYSLQVPHIFKELFEEDILEEEVIFEWAKKVKYSIEEENVTLILRIV